MKSIYQYQRADQVRPKPKWAFSQQLKSQLKTLPADRVVHTHIYTHTHKRKKDSRRELSRERQIFDCWHRRHTDMFNYIQTHTTVSLFISFEVLSFVLFGGHLNSIRDCTHLWAMNRQFTEQLNTAVNSALYMWACNMSYNGTLRIYRSVQNETISTEWLDFTAETEECDKVV